MVSTMDFLNGVFDVPSVSVSGSSKGSGLSLGAMRETFVGIAVAVVMVVLELRRRGNAFAGGPDVARGQPSRCSHASTCKLFMRRYWGEGVGLALCAGIAIALRMRGDVTGSPVEQDQAWAEIKRQWPLLLTADSLLAIQSMLRLTLFLSILLRAGATDGSEDASPLAAEPAALFAAGALCRMGLLATSSVYMLDGPLGGWLPAGCDIAALPVLLPLGRHAIRTPRRCLAFLLLIFACGHVAMRNHLALADENWIANVLFSHYHVLDLVASFAHIMHTAVKGGASFNGGWFVHFLLPLQQGLAAYYFLAAFESAPELIGAGKPFELLQIGGAAQLGMYFGASALFISELLEAPEPSRYAVSY